MRLSAVAFCMILTTIFLSACGQDGNVAAVDDKGGNYYSRNGVLALGGPMGSSGGLGQVSGRTEQSAEVMSVTSNDLAPASGKSQNIASAASWQWPVNGAVTGTYGQKAEGVVNEGIVISAAEGAPIKAAQAGEVAYVGQNTKIYGNIVILRHANGDMTAYSHAKSVAVARGQQVKAGEVIATVGQSGNAKAPQLHFAMRHAGTSIDPLTRLPHNVASN